MQHPTKQQVQTVIDNLYKAKKMAKGDCPVNMMVTGVPHKNICGSPACHGGWYALVTGLNDYDEGGDKMAIDLGFRHRILLESWAADNAAIWGNPSGRFMFCDGTAFGWNTDNGSLQQIIDHWEGVKERLPA